MARTTATDRWRAHLVRTFPARRPRGIGPRSHMGATGAPAPPRGRTARGGPPWPPVWLVGSTDLRPPKGRWVTHPYPLRLAPDGSGPVQSCDRPIPSIALPETALGPKAENTFTRSDVRRNRRRIEFSPVNRETHLKGGNHVKSDLRFLLLPVSGVALLA